MPNPQNLKKPWKKGESGNPKGGKKKPPTMKQMVEVLPELPLIFAKVLSEKKGDMTAIEAGLRRMVSSWINSGNINAGRLILEYAYGKPQERKETTEAEYTPPIINVTVTPEAIKKASEE